MVVTNNFLGESGSSRTRSQTKKRKHDEYISSQEATSTQEETPKKPREKVQANLKKKVKNNSKTKRKLEVSDSESDPIEDSSEETPKKDMKNKKKLTNKKVNKEKKKKKSLAKIRSSTGVKKKTKTKKKKLKRDGVTERISSASRCSMKKVIDLVLELKEKHRLPSGHVKCMTETPFGVLFEAMYNKQIDPTNVKGLTTMYANAMILYNRNTHKFSTPNEELMITPEDFALIFGIPAYGKNFDQKKTTCAFRRRIFPDLKEIKTKDIRPKIISLAEDTTRLGEQDFARCMTLFMIAHIFDANSCQRAALRYVKVTDDLKNLKDFGWGQEFCSRLITNMHNTINPREVQGCVVAVVYWILEYTLKFKRAHPNVSPRSATWDFREIGDDWSQLDFHAVQFNRAMENIENWEEELIKKPEMELENLPPKKKKFEVDKVDDDD